MNAYLFKLNTEKPIDCIHVDTVKHEMFACR